MRSGSEKSYRPRLEMLEDRTTPAVVLSADLLPAPPEAGQVVAVLVTTQAAEEGRQATEGRGSLTVAVVTEIYPMPVDVDRPGTLPAPIMPADPAAVFTLVSYERS